MIGRVFVCRACSLIVVLSCCCSCGREGGGGRDRRGDTTIGFIVGGHGRFCGSGSTHCGVSIVSCIDCYGGGGRGRSCGRNGSLGANSAGDVDVGSRCCCGCGSDGGGGSGGSGPVPSILLVVTTMV